MLVAVCVPSRDWVHAGFAFAMAEMMCLSANSGVKCASINYRGSCPGMQRNELAKIAALYNSFTHIMWLDSDVVAPDDTIIRLLSHEKDIVCATYRSRKPPHWLYGDFIEEGDNLRRATFLPMGAMLVNTEVYRKMAYPWHWESYPEIEEDTLNSEDANFCKKAMEDGYELWCDMKLSKEIRHLTERELTWWG